MLFFIIDMVPGSIDRRTILGSLGMITKYSRIEGQDMLPEQGDEGIFPPDKRHCALCGITSPAQGKDRWQYPVKHLGQRYHLEITL